MTSPLKVIALISGGKDSLFSILHCLANGHTIVALANLHPPTSTDGTGSREEDLDSYMYQTVGHTVIPLYESALGIPLYRQEILGAAVNTDRDYSTKEEGGQEDETESLVPLLMKVKGAHPEANAISTGAILSTYQRTRVENVALRVGLTPLGYLWRYPYLPTYEQSGLLRDMAAVDQDARIIKVASGGLDQSFLWENVADDRTIARLVKAMARFGENGDGAVLGEGGEFETLAVDGPGVLWKRRIEIVPDGVVSGEGGSATFKGKDVKVVEKKGDENGGLEKLRIPDLWDNEFKQILHTLSTSQPASVTSPPIEAPARTLYDTLPTNIATTTAHTITISNMCPPQGYYPDASSQLSSIISHVPLELAECYVGSASISHSTLLLRYMSDFSILNPIYSSIFTSPNPPSRVTVACGDEMPEGADVMLSVMAWRNTTPTSHVSRRKGLHVQSRSYWAPANIGPYSQAISTPVPLPADYQQRVEKGDVEGPEIVYVAGQIPLVPASMEVYNHEGFRGQAVLALQHLWRIGRAMDVGWWTTGVAYISSSSPSDASSRVHIAQEAWRAIHAHYLLNTTEDDSDDDDIDPWDLKNRTRSQQTTDITYRSPLPNPSAVALSDSKVIPPCFIVQVSQLPREVDIEWHSTGLAKCSRNIKTSSNPTMYSNGVHTCFTTEVEGTDTKLFALEIGVKDAPEALKRYIGDSIDEGNAAEYEWEHVTLYAGPGLGREWCDLAEGLQWVPCIRVWGQEGREALGVFVGRVSVKRGKK